MPRRAKLKQLDFARHGFTAGCLGCEQIQLRSPNRKNHTEACRRRTEDELGKTSEGQDRLERAKDRLDTRMAEIGQAKLDRAADEPREDQIPGRKDVEGSTEEAEENTAMDQNDISPSIPRNAPEPERFDIASREATPKRRIGEDDMEEDSHKKRPRPRSPTISYRTDAESVGSNMDDRAIDMLNDTDKKILSAPIMGVDITEIYSPERVARVARKLGLVSGSSVELTKLGF